MSAKKIIGVWRLVSCEGRSSGGEVMYPFGTDPFGLLIYDQNGYMSVMLMRRGRPKFVSNTAGGGTHAEIKTAFEGFDAYCGTYELDEGKGIVTHHIEASRFPNWEGTDQLRYFQLSGGLLLLSTSPVLSGGEDWTFHLAWKPAR